MTITPVQPKIENTESRKSYRDANTPIKTNDLVKPLPPKGHLVHDGILSVPKYLAKDFVYDMKAVKDGIRGEANDHQLGRMNDVGIKLAGIGIAGYLASKTTNPAARIMEYAGLGAFLAAMSLYPKVAIKMPSEALHGFDTGVEYIDDQGRKKSVFQDQNYIPYDMYQGKFSDEDLAMIGDKLGIPRNIKNRNDLTKEQMRKLAIQNNTLGVLTIGFATPVISALLCYGGEKLITPALEMSRNVKYDTQISHYLRKTENMSTAVENISSNSLSRKVEAILKNYKGKEIPNAELENIISLITNEVDNNLTEGIREDLKSIFSSEYQNYVLDENFAENTVKSIENNLPASNKETLKAIFVPSKEEIADAVRKSGSDSKIMNADQMQEFRGALKELFSSKINNANGISKEYLKSYQSDVIENITKSIKTKPSNFVSEQSYKDVINFAKIIGEFKSNEKGLDKCKSFKFEYAPETVLARSYNKFESTLLDVLDIKYKDLKPMRESEKYAQEILEQKINNLVQDEAKYQKALDKLAKVMTEMEVNLNGSSSTESHIADLIMAIENNYNNTARRLDSAAKGKFRNTIDRLVKEDVSTLSNSVNSREDVFNLLDGTNKAIEGDGREAAKKCAAGIGSSKNNEIARILDRYQGTKNTFNRVIHTLDVYGRKVPEDAYGKELLEKGKKALISATSSDHNMKLGTINNPMYYRDIFNTIWGGQISDKTKKALGETKDMSKGNLLGRFQNYIEKFRIVVGNNKIDFTKPEHHVDGIDMNRKYNQSANTRKARFNLIAQNPVELVKNAANRRYGNQLWLRRVSVFMGSILGVTLLAQLGFGKIKNPHNIQKQVSDDTNN